MRFFIPCLVGCTLAMLIFLIYKSHQMDHLPKTASLQTEAPFQTTGNSSLSDSFWSLQKVPHQRKLLSHQRQFIFKFFCSYVALVWINLNQLSSFIFQKVTKAVSSAVFAWKSGTTVAAMKTPFERHHATNIPKKTLLHKHSHGTWVSNFKLTFLKQQHFPNIAELSKNNNSIY